MPDKRFDLRILKGQIKFEDSIKQLYPSLNVLKGEFTPVNFPPYDDHTLDKSETYRFAKFNTFKQEVQGRRQITELLEHFYKA